jgi:hypothetical protein
MNPLQKESGKSTGTGDESTGIVGVGSTREHGWANTS